MPKLSNLTKKKCQMTVYAKDRKMQMMNTEKIYSHKNLPEVKLSFIPNSGHLNIATWANRVWAGQKVSNPRKLM